MGGDHAPAVVVEGALLAAQDVDAELILVGDKLAVEKECLRLAGKLPALPIVNASQTVPMDESPSVALRKRDSSMKVAFEMIKRGEAQAAVLMRPITLSEIETVVHSGDRLPPRSVSFYPEMFAGLFGVSLEDPVY